jgi:HD superfamily phosphohydrolase
LFDGRLLQIVANATNGVDVDKVDYLQRDALMAGVGQRYNFTALLSNCRVSCNPIACVHGLVTY